VTIQAASGASASMGLDMNAATNLNLQNLTITGGQIGGSSRNITVGHSNFTGLFAIQTTTANANIVFDANRHVNLNSPSGALPARVTVWASGVPSGVTVENSYFAGGDADGVRPDSDSVQVLNNEFADLTDVGGNHTDPIQLYGGTRAVIRGNYFHNANGNISAYIMQADGGDHNIIEDNVFAAGQGVGYGITLYSDNGSIIEHNTWQQGSCDFSIPCGTLNLGNKSGEPASKGTIIRDNILAGLGGGQGSYTEDHNLFTNATGTGTGDLKGTPNYTGPLTSWAGYRLTAGSLGTHAASDGTDIGIR
jgi:hypothetical protein